jgi:hypothetical protein
MFVARAVRLHLPVLAAAALLVTACGSAGSSTTAVDSPSAGPSHSGASVPPGTPDCSAVWQKGATLPRGYRGCAEDADFVPRDALGCESGQRIVRYANQYYAVPGGTIQAATKPLDHDRQYLAAVRRCRA